MASRLRLNAAADTISTGRRFAGALPEGSPRSTQTMSPRVTTRWPAASTSPADGGGRGLVVGVGVEGGVQSGGDGRGVQLGDVVSGRSGEELGLLIPSSWARRLAVSNVGSGTEIAIFTQGV